MKPLRLFLICGCLLWLGIAIFAAPAREAFSDELDADLYDCTLTLKTGPALARDAMARITLEATGEQHAVLLSVAPKALYVAGLRDGIKKGYGQAAVTVTPGTPITLTVQRRGARLSILQNDTRIYQGEIPHAAGAEGAISVDPGWTLEKATVQRLEPVIFADDFMRTADEQGKWTVQRGTWKLQSAWDQEPHGNTNRFNMALYAQNPFAWVGKVEHGTALCTAGQPTWEDYTFATSVRPGAGGAIGLVVNIPDATRGLLVRWSPANDRSPRGNRLTIEQLAAGKTTVLAESPGGFIPGQWYKLAVVSSLGTLRVRVDGQERLQVRNVSPWRGGVGLYSESTDGAIFDDITVYGLTVNTDLLEERTRTTIQQHFLNDYRGMRTWAVPSDWFTTEAGVNISQYDYFGDHWLVTNVRPSNGNGTLTLVLNGNGRDETEGYRATITVESTQKQTTYRLFHDATELKSATGELLDTREETSLRFRRAGTMLTLEVDGTPMLTTAATAPAPGLRPAFRAEGCFRNVKNVLALGRNLLDYTFTEAPVDWIGAGTWLPTVRWSCQPQWSFYSGWSRGDAVLWHKQRFVGDQTLQVYMGNKMEVPRERIIYEDPHHYHDACISICTDGHNPRSGYTILSGQQNAFGRPSSETLLLRNGVPVARLNTSVYGWGLGHRTWFDMELRKRGDTVEFWLDGALAISYRDPHPLDGGVPAIWTTDNGLSIARVRLRYVNPPQPRTDTQVALDDPWFPEWVNVRQPLALEFPNAWSTSGKPVALQVTTRSAPAQAAAPEAAGKRVVFTPTKIGEFWYQVTASDGKTTSPAFNLFGMAFDPALGRDDSHALVLYRFNEGTGAVVHDRAPLGTPADLQVPAFPNTRWMPTQGLTFCGPAPLKTAAGVEKLLAIARNQACTLELWVSNDTAYFPQNWLGCLLTWEKSADQRNILIGGHKANFVAAPFGGHFDPTNENNTPNLNGSYCAYMGFRTSLRHMVVTWDGTTTRGYTDGQPLVAQQIAWNPDKWSADAPLLLGNRTDGQRTYLGTYYLVAIHDRCFTDAEVLRHYQAGPSAVWEPGHAR